MAVLNPEDKKRIINIVARIIIPIALAAAVLIYLFMPGIINRLGGKSEDETITRNVYLLDTFCQLIIYEGGGEAAMESAVDRLNYYDDIFNKSKENSDIYKINNRSEDRVSIEADTADMLKIARDMCIETGGVLEPAIAPITDLWDFKDEKKVPEESEIEKALKEVKSLEWDIEENTFVAYDKDVRIDIGSFAKGYVADRLKDDMLKNGVTSAIINLGGNIHTIGEMPEGRPFRMAIAEPEKSTEEYSNIVEITDSSIVTAGIYERCFEEDGVLYHHILDPATGYPVQNDLESVSVVGPESVICDALCTAIFIMGEEEGSEFLSRYNQDHGTDYYAVFLRKDGSSNYYYDVD